MIDVLSYVVWSNLPYECRVYAMDLHRGCSNKNVSVTYCYSELLVHSYGDTVVIVSIKGFSICHKTS